MNDIAIRVSNLSKCYQIYDQPRDRLKQFVLPRLQGIVGQPPKKYFREFWALKDVSFEVKKGETVGIIGRNGSGKSTLLQMIAGTLNPTCGSITTNGRIAALLELGAGFNPEFSGRENVYLNAALFGLSPKEINDRYIKILHFADIGDFIDQPIKTYSSGMVVRLAFAVSVFIEPDILVVDEALAVGDAAFQLKCFDRLKQLTDSGTTLLFVSHDISMVKNYCEDVIYLQKGEIRAVGTAAEMAELYFFDMRDEQRRGSGGGPGVSIKPFLGGGKGIAFGTEEGYIVSAEFTNSGGTFSSYKRGEEISIRVKAKVLASVAHPSLSLIIQDQRMMDLGGAFFTPQREEFIDEIVHFEMTMKFFAILASGRYSITLRLEDRPLESGLHFRPLDKQVSVLTFEMLEDGYNLLGPIDFGIFASHGLNIDTHHENRKLGHKND